MDVKNIYSLLFELDIILHIHLLNRLFFIMYTIIKYELRRYLQCYEFIHINYEIFTLMRGFSCCKPFPEGSTLHVCDDFLSPIWQYYVILSQFIKTFKMVGIELQSTYLKVNQPEKIHRIIHCFITTKR